MLKLITGRIASGKTQMLIDAIGRRIRKREKSILIVPDHVTYHFEQRLCHQLNISGFIDVDVCSFNRLASKIIEYSGHGEKRFLDDTGRAMIVRACIAEVEEKLTVFKDASSRKGFAEKSLQMISTLENCGYSPDDLHRVAEQLPESVLKAKLTDMAAIFDRYTAFLATGYTDNADRLKDAESKADDYLPLKDTAIFIDGFDVFTSRLYSFIGALLRRTDVTIAISDARDYSDRAAYEIHQQTKEKLIRLAQENGVKIDESQQCDYRDAETSEEILFLRDHFYARDKEVYHVACTHVFPEQYPDVTSEVTAAAQRIARGVRAGRRYRDYSVLCNDLNRYTPVMTAVFRRYGIPVFTDAKHDVVTHPVAMYLFSLLKCVNNGFLPDDVGDYLLSGLTPLDKDESDRFRAMIEQADIKNYELEHGLKREAFAEDDQAFFDKTRETVMQPLLAFRADLSAAGSAKAMSSVCYGFLKAQGVYDRLNDLVDAYEALEFFDLADVTSQLWNLSQELLESLASLWGDRPINVRQFYEALFEGFCASPVSTIPSVLDCVTFGDLESGREQPTHTVFLLGVNDGVIPAIYNDERLVSPAEAETLMAYSMELANSASTEDARMRYNVYAAVSLAKDTLFVSCPLYTDAGSALRPSHLFERFLRLFPGIKISVMEKRDPISDLRQPLTKDQALLALAESRAVSGEAMALSAYFEETGDRRYQLLKNGRRETDISPSLAAKLFSPDEAINISRLETFAECPFKHFIQYGLSPKSDDPFEAMSSDVGTFFHQVLNDFVKSTKDEPAELTKKECFRLTGDLFDKALPSIRYGVFEASNRQKAVNKRLKTVISQCAWKVYHQLRGVNRNYTELSFGYDKEKPIEIQTEYGTLRLRGKIDRVDVIGMDQVPYLRVVDYKSGSIKYGEKEQADGRSLQLMLYMETCLERFGGSHPAAAFYMELTEGEETEKDIKGVFNEQMKDRPQKNTADTILLSENDFREMIRSTHQTAEAKGTQMLAGRIEAAPAKPDSCVYCAYRSLCNKSKKAVNADAELDS